jgi:serine protease AprX
MKSLFFLLFIFLQTSFTQQKYMIYFTDKGTDAKLLSKGSDAFLTASSELSERSIERRKKVMGEDFITFEDLPVRKDYINYLTAEGVKIDNILKWFNAVSACIPEETKSKILNYPFVKNIEPVRSFLTHKPEVKHLLKKTLQDSALYGASFAQYKLSDIPQVHSKGITGKGVLMGILDTGFRWKTHEALSHADVLAEYDFIFDDEVTQNEPEDVSSQQSHGTIVFSVISGYKDSVLIGAAYDAGFLLAKTEDVRSETRVEEDNYAAALEWMEGLGVDITISSLGYSEFDDFSYEYADMDGNTTIVTRAAELAFQRGVLTITSAGNEGNKQWVYITAPADGFNTISVGAVDKSNRIAAFSSRGPSADGRIKPDIAAAGVSVFGATSSGDNMYGAASGTSLAAPIAAGSAALLLSAHPHLTNVQMRDIIFRTADNYQTPDNSRGYGLISAAGAVEYPNLEFRNGRYILNKIFIDTYSDDMDLYLSTDRNTFVKYELTRDSLRYSFTLPAYNQNQKIYFYYMGPDSLFRIPSPDYYSLTYGNLIINKTSVTVPDYILSHNYPNPFNSSTNISFVVKEQSDVELVIYDALGQKVRTLFKASGTTGEYTVNWNGRKDNGLYCASGMYIYRLRINDNEISKKMILLK